MIRRVMAPVTFADDSFEAARVAGELAAALGAELVLVGIAPVPRSEPGLVVNDPVDAARQVEEQTLLDRIVGSRLRDAAAAAPTSMPARTLLVHGPVGQALLFAAQHDGADIVVLPIRRHTGIGHVLHDHDDRYVLHRAGMPVLVVPTGDHSNHDGLARDAA